MKCIRFSRHVIEPAAVLPKLLSQVSAFRLRGSVQTFNTADACASPTAHTSRRLRLAKPFSPSLRAGHVRGPLIKTREQTPRRQIFAVFN